MVGMPDGFGGKLIRMVSFLSFPELSSESPKPVMAVGPRGRRGGGLLACGFGLDCFSFAMISYPLFRSSNRIQ